MAKRTVLFGGSFNPPTKHHRVLAEVLASQFDRVIVIPCGLRPDKLTTNDTLSTDRAAMVDMNFRGIPNLDVDLFDLEGNDFTRTFELNEKYKHLDKVWHFVGTDLICGGGKGESIIQREWGHGPEIWRGLNFAVAERVGFPYDPSDLPPHSIVLKPPYSGSSTEIREKILKHQSIGDLVVPEVEAYIDRHNLYLGRLPRASTMLNLGSPRIKIVVDPENPKAVALARSLSNLENPENPNLIVVVGGDGTMLHAIRNFWRLRVPFLGINTGHRGFLLNNLEVEKIREIFSEGLIAWQSPLLYVESKRSDDSVNSGLAFNDAWAERASGSTAWFTVRINGVTKIQKLVGDSILVSTPAGSTAYARAMGATPLLVGTPALILVGSNIGEPPGWKSAYIPADAEVEIVNADSSLLNKRPILGFVDSVNVGEVRSMTIRASRTAFVELAYLPERDLAEKLMEIQFPIQKE
ncbi:MAG: NAD(+)/NADH kinase, partial [Patescibacteria group bacterium]